MPKIRRSRKKPPDGWELIEPTLEELEQKMREGNCCCLCIFPWVSLTTPFLTKWFDSICSGNRSTRRQANQRIPVANFQSASSEVAVHLRFILSTWGHQPWTVRLLYCRENSRCQFDSEMEKIGLRKFMLPALHPNPWHKLRHKLYMPRTKIKIRRRPNRGMRTLRLPWMLRLNVFTTSRFHLLFLSNYTNRL